MAPQGQLELLYSKGFKPICVYVDPQSALKSLETKFPNVSIEAAGAKDLPASGWIFARSSGWLSGTIARFSTGLITPQELGVSRASRYILAITLQGLGCFST